LTFNFRNFGKEEKSKLTVKR